MSSAEIRIGTSGWHYKHWAGTFYPPRTSGPRMLALYLEHFDTVELNNTFYRLPPVKAVAAWRDSTPDNFVFAVKGSRFLTHMKKLKDPGPGVEKFFDRIAPLDAKLGPILFQLPPHWEVDSDRLRGFLEALPPSPRYAFEFRNQTWHTPEILDILRSWNAAWCPFHLAGYRSPVEITADFTYVRLHGPGGKYQGSYSDQELSEWASRIREWSRSLRAIYIYFDNDDSGFAPANALRLRDLVHG